MSAVTPDRQCQELARRQSGTISRSQAREIGLSPKQIDHRVAHRIWTPRHRGVYLVGGAPSSWEQELWSAYLALAPHGVVSHRSAAAMWELDGVSKKHIELTLPHTSRARLKGVVIHRARELPARQVRTKGGLHVTSPERTLIDLAAVAPLTVLEPALDSALRRRLTAIPRLNALLFGARGRKGVSNLRRLLVDRSPHERPSESWLESRLFALLRELGLPPPQRQVKVSIGDRYVARIDFAYPDLRVGLEAAGYRYHGDQPGWHRDMARRNELMLLGWRVLYFAWLDLKHRRDEIKQQVLQLIEDASGVQRLLGASDPL